MSNTECADARGLDVDRRQCVSVRSLSIVMPVFNECDVIADVVKAHAAYASEAGFDDWEIICVDDASTDGTREALLDLQKTIPRLRVHAHAKNEGIYQSFRDGFRISRSDYIYETASDGQWPVSNIDKLMSAVQERGADLAVGVRTNRRQVYSRARRIISSAYNFLSEVTFGVAVFDAGAIKLGRRELFNVPVYSNGVVSAAERIARAVKSRCSVVFVPIEFVPRTSGVAMGARPAVLIRSVLELVRCFFQYRSG